MTRIGGEFRDPARDYPLHRVRTEFLRVLERLAPETLEKLEADVLPTYQATWHATLPAAEERSPRGPLGGPGERQEDPPWLFYRWERGDWDAVGEELADLKTRLLKWGRRFHLTDPWMLDVALRTIRRWHYERLPPDKNEGPHAEPQTAATPPPSEPRFVDPPLVDIVEVVPFEFEHDGWIAMRMPASEYRAAVVRRFKEALDDYMNTIRGFHVGLPLAPEKRARKRKRAPQEDADPFVHIEWLVLFQVKLMRHEEIAERFEKGDPKTVAAGIRQAAAFAGITRRRPLKGRARQDVGA